jgi:hypothetical protein
MLARDVFEGEVGADIGSWERLSTSRVDPLLQD